MENNGEGVLYIEYEKLTNYENQPFCQFLA